MKIAPFLLCAQISCALVAALDGILSEGVKVSELFDRSQLAAENGYQVGYGQKGLPKRLWRREDQESQVEKRSVETEHNDAPAEGAKDKWTSFSEGLNTRERWVEVEKRSGGVFKRDSSTEKVNVGGFKVEKEHILAFIVGDQYKGQCDKLKSRCQELGYVDPNLTEVDGRVKKLCNEKDTICDTLKNEIQTKCNKLKQDLENKFPQRGGSQLKYEDCATYEPQCFFLEGASPSDLKDGCSKLRDECYEMKRNKVADVVLLMVLKGNLKEKTDCEKKLKEHCPLLSKQSNELMQSCIGPKEECEELIDKVKTDSKALKGEITKVVGKDEQLKVQCPPLLEKCFLYSEDGDDVKTECEKLEKQCKEKNITYAPLSPPFSPIEQAPGLLDRIGLDELHKESARNGVFIGRPWELHEDDFLVLITPSSGQFDDECKKKLQENCDYYKNLTKNMDTMCKEKKGGSGGRDGDGRCTNLKQNSLSDKCKNLKNRLDNKGIKINKNEFQGWHELPINSLTERDCADYELQCLYLEKHCKNELEVGCQNLRRTCYRRALDDVAYVELEKRLRGELAYKGFLGRSETEEQKNLLEHCEQLRNQSVELFKLCMDPKNTLNLLRDDIHEKARILKPALDDRRDFPTEKDCVELEKQCEHLEADSDLVEEACHTLRTRCQFRDLSEELKHRLLEEREKTLKTSDECVKMLETKCHHWNRKWKNPFTFPCALRNDSCKLMMQRVEEHCNAFESNLKIKKIADDAKNPLKQEEICLQWNPYCDTLVPNCNKTKNNEIETHCKTLKENCEKFLKRWDLEEELMKELQGNLNNNNCTKTLNILCTPVKNVTNPKSSNLSSLCKDEKKGDDDKVREDLCKKLVERIQKRCPLLKIKLNKAKNEVVEMSDEYEKIKKEAEQAFKESAVIVSAVLKEEEKKIVRRDVKKSTESGKQELMPLLITAKERDAIELSAQAMSLYMELKDMCEPLLLDCGFKKECKECETACTTIEAKCTSIKAPEVRSPAVITKECKPGNGTEKGQSSESKPTGKGGPSGEGKSGGGAPKPSKPEAAGEKKCDPVKTVDKWTTTTSTYTTTTTSTKTTTLKVTLTSTRKCKPTKCTTGKPESTSKSEEEEVVPSGGKRWLPSVGIAIVGVVVAIM